MPHQMNTLTSTIKPHHRVLACICFTSLPSASTLAFSSGRFGLWSPVGSTARPPRLSTARRAHGETVDRKCMWDLGMVNSLVDQLAEAFSITTPLSKEDRDEWVDRIKDWKGNDYYRKIVLPALLDMRSKEVEYDVGYARVCCL